MLDVDDLADRIRRHMATELVPAVGLGVVERGVPSLVQGFGVESVEHPEQEVTQDTCFRIGSVTKPIVATTIVRLAERGELDLDAPLEQVQAEGATLRTLLSHASGLADAGFVAPATYSNTAYVLAAKAAETATGLTIDELVAEAVLGPLSMHSTGFDAPGRGSVLGHELHQGGLRPVAQPVRDEFAPARGAYSTTADLVAFALAHLGIGKPLLEPESLSKMHQSDIGRRFAIGFEIRDYKGVRLVRHSGDIGPFRAWFVLAPSEGCAVVMLCSRPPMFRLTSAPFRILDAALDLPDFPFTLGCPACGAELFDDYRSCGFCTPVAP